MNTKRILLLSFFCLAVCGCSPKINSIQEPYAWKVIEYSSLEEKLSFIEKRIRVIEVSIEEQEDLLERYFQVTAFHQRRTRERLGSLKEEMRALVAEREKILKS